MGQSFAGLALRAFDLRGGNREALAPLGAPPLKYLTPILRRHAHEESMRALAVPAVWLESYTHCRIPCGEE
jgi:hypothetical protein